MADYRWIGGAASNTQIMNVTPAGTIHSGDHFTLTIEDELGVDHALTATCSATTVKNVVEAVQALAAAQTTAPYVLVTWTEDDTKVIATAKVSGTRFTLSSSASTTATAAPTFTTATGTDNSGPHDFKTLANFIKASGAAATATMVAGDTLRINQGAYDILCGLRATGLDLESLHVGKQYRGSVGDPVTGAKLCLEVNNTASASFVAIDTRGRAVLLHVLDTPEVFVNGCPANSDVKIGGDADYLEVLGGDVRGRVTAEANMTLDYVYTNGCPNAVVTVEAGVLSLDKVEANSGAVTLKSACTTINVGPHCRFEHAATSTATNGAGMTASTVTNRGGTIMENSGGHIAMIDNEFGMCDLRMSKADSLTVINATCRGGLITDLGSLANINWTNKIKARGGMVTVESAEIERFAAI